MKLERLKLRGAIGIKKHMGLDEIELDFTKLGPGLTALTGPNGMGKTTVLENMHPYRTLGSRPGALTNHFFLADSYRELSFYLGDDHYRSLIKINGESGRTEAFLYKNGDEKSLTNGAATKYDKAVKKLMGSKDLFFNSAFTAQNSDSLSDLKTHELKALIGEFIKLDRYIAFEKTANSCAGILNSRVEALTTEINDCQREIDALQVTDEQVAVEEQTLTDIKTELATLNNEAGALLEQINAQKEAQAKNEKLQAEQALFFKQFQELTADIDSYVRQRAEEVAKVITEKNRALTVAISDKQDQATKATREVATALQENQKKADAVYLNITQLTATIENAPDIAQVKADLERARACLAVLREEATANQSERQSMNTQLDTLMAENTELRSGWDKSKAEFDQRIQAAEKKYHQIHDLIDDEQNVLASLDDDQKLFNLNLRVEMAQEQTAVLDTIDTDCTSTTCGAIAHALKAKKSIKEIQADIEARKAEVEKIVTEGKERIKKATADLELAEKELSKVNAEKLEAYEAVTTRVGEINKTIEAVGLKTKQATEQYSEISWAIDAAERAIDIYNELITQNADLSAINERLSTAKKELGRINAEATTLKMRHEQSLSDIHKEIDQLEQQLADLQQNGCPESKAAAERWDGLIAQATEKKDRARQSTLDIEKQIDAQVGVIISDLREKHASITEQIEKLTVQSNEGAQRLTQLKTQLAQKAMQEKQKARLIADQTAVNTEASEWTYLKNACSKDGFRALEIDSVAPAIAATANELLHSTFGSGTSIEIITQDPETGKEILDIMVHTADGDCTEITLFSGGEKVWLLKACRLALTMISKERSGHIIDSCFADEEDGALDPDKAVQFVNLYRSFINQGDFYTGFFISHKPACIAMADHLISFSSNGVSIN